MEDALQLEFSHACTPQTRHRIRSWEHSGQVVVGASLLSTSGSTSSNSTRRCKKTIAFFLRRSCSCFLFISCSCLRDSSSFFHSFTCSVMKIFNSFCTPSSAGKGKSGMPSEPWVTSLTTILFRSIEKHMVFWRDKGSSLER